MSDSRITKRSQRPSLTCSACAKSKVRCSKTIPCIRCTEQGRGHLCSRQPVQINTKRAWAEQQTELRVLRKITEQLEDSESVLLLQRVHDRIKNISSDIEKEPGPDKGHHGSSKCRASSSTSSAGSISGRVSDIGQTEGLNDHKGLALSLEYLAWGRSYQNHSDTASDSKATPRNTTISEDIMRLHLPNKQVAEKLVLFHIRLLCWHHNAIHSSRFLEQCELFWETGSMVDPLWIALYFSILSTAAWCYPDDEGSELATDLKRLAETWYDEMASSLHRNRFMDQHSIYSVQAITVSTLVAHPLGHSNSHYILLSAAIRIAQCMGLGKTEKKQPTLQMSPGAWESAVDEETKKRVWWQLVIQDYFAVPFTETYTVNPNHVSMAFPSNCDDHDLEDMPADQPTISSYCIILAKMASLMPELVDGRHRLSSAAPSQRYQHVLEMDFRMRDLVFQVPPFLLRQTPEDPQWPPWVNWARRTLTISAADKIIMIHREFLVQSFQSPMYAYTRTTCLSASLTILREYERINKAPVANIWIVPAFTISAAIVVVLDLLYRPEPTTETGENQRLVHAAIKGLLSTKQNRMAQRGANIMMALLEEEEERRRPGSSASKGVFPTSLSFKVKRRLEETDLDKPQPGYGDAEGAAGPFLPETGDCEPWNTVPDASPVHTTNDQLELWFNQLNWNMTDDIALDPLRNASFVSEYGHNMFGED